MGAIVTGLVFLISGALVYAYNTESTTSKITFSRFGLHVGEVETAAILLGLGLFFLALGALRFLQRSGGDEE